MNRKQLESRALILRAAQLHLFHEREAAREIARFARAFEKEQAWWEKGCPGLDEENLV